MKYLVIKNKGYGENVTVINTEVNASINIGGVSTFIVDTLRKEGYDIGAESEIKIQDEWKLEVNKETGQLLARSAMRMVKPPVRRKTKTKPKAEETKDTSNFDTTKKVFNKQVDAFDVLFGMADYM